MKRILSLAAATALGLSLLTACGGDDGGSAGGDDYCDDLKAAKKSLDNLDNAELGSLDEAADQMRDLADSAPDDLKDDWETLLGGFEAILKAFEDAGLTEEDLEALQSGQIPEGVDMAALQQAMTELEELNGEKFEEASDNIAKHAKDECGVDLEA